MKVTLKSTNTTNYPSVEKTILLVPREKEILITTEDGREIAKLTISIMDKDQHDPLTNKFKVVPSNSYWVEFHAVEANIQDTLADVFFD